MKKIAPPLVLCLTLLFSAAHSLAQINYDVKGTLKGIENGKVTISFSKDLLDQKPVKLDSGKVTSGRFELKGRATGPEMVHLAIEPGNWSFDFFIENGTVNVTADTTGAKHYDYTKYGYGKGAFFINYTETGSKNFNDYKVYRNDPYSPLIDSLDKQYEVAENKRIHRPKTSLAQK